jgi:hypothetical protein
MSFVHTLKIQEENKVKLWTSKQVKINILRNNNPCFCVPRRSYYGSRFKSIYGPLHFFLNCEKSNLD